MADVRSREDTAGAARIERIYAGYASDHRKRRAWAAENPGNQAIREELLIRLCGLAQHDIRSGADILDIGCGSGWFLAELARRGVDGDRLHGIELLGGRALAARQRLRGVEVAEGDCMALPWSDRRFGFALLLTVLSSLESRGEVDRALHEAARVLRPGGLLLIYEPRVANPGNAATRRVSARQITRALGGRLMRETLTVAPPVARRLGSRTSSIYPALARLTALRTHQLVAWRKPQA